MFSGQNRKKHKIVGGSQGAHRLGAIATRLSVEGLAQKCPESGENWVNPRVNPWKTPGKLLEMGVPSIGVPPVIIHFERWDFPRNKHQAFGSSPIFMESPKYYQDQ